MKDRIKDWESAAFAGLMLALRKYKDRLREERHYVLNEKPRELDIRILDMKHGQGERMSNAIACFFEAHNLVELKNPYEELNIDVFWIGISYAAQYKGSGYDSITGKSGVDAVKMKDVTLTFLRASKPVGLFACLKEQGGDIKNAFPGIYVVTGIAAMKIQIVVGAELSGDEFVPLRVQKSNANVDDIRKFMDMVDGLEEINEKMLADTIMQISISENGETYQKLKEDEKMCKAFRELMKDEIKEELDKSRAEIDKRQGELDKIQGELDQAHTELDQAHMELKKRQEYLDNMQEESARTMLQDGIIAENVAKYTKLGIDKVIEIAQSLKMG